MEQHRPIESASASTACQTSQSNIAYILTAAVLGFIALLGIAITLFVFAAFGWSLGATGMLGAPVAERAQLHAPAHDA